MHYATESDYEAANIWLHSFGDDSDSDWANDESTESSSPSDGVKVILFSRRKVASAKIMHAHNFVGRNVTRVAIKPLCKDIKPLNERREISDKRMKGDYLSGCRGVSWNRRMQAWLAFWMDGKVRRSKTFSSKVHGFEPARKMAIEFLREKRREAGLGSPSVDEEEDPAPPLAPNKSSTRAKGSSSAPSSARSSLCSVSTAFVELGKSN